MIKLFSLLTAVTLVLLQQVPTSNALSCMPQTFEQQMESDIIATIKAEKLLSTDASQSISSTFTWKISVNKLYKGQLNNESVITDNVWPGSPETISRLVAGNEYIVFLGQDLELGMCNYPRNLRDQPLTDEELDLLTPDSMPSCEPYVCKDGTTYAACSSDGHVINYFAPPCHANGGDAESSSSSMSTSGFTDVGTNHPNYEAIMWAKAQGIVQGYGDGSFKPDSTINRAEFVTIVNRAGEKLLRNKTALKNANTNCIRNAEESNPNGFPFNDVDLNSWYFEGVCTALFMQWVSGYLDSTFKPEQNINFVEAAKIIAMLSSEMTVFNDSIYTWYSPYTDYLTEHNAKPSSITAPDQLITRAEMVEMMFRLDAYVVTGITRFTAENEEFSFEYAGKKSDQRDMRIAQIQNKLLHLTFHVRDNFDANPTANYTIRPIKVTTLKGKKVYIFKYTLSELGLYVGQPYIMYLFELKNNKLFEIIFSGDTVLSQEEQQVLDSLEFKDE